MLQLLGMLLAAKAPKRQPLRAGWPLHRVLKDLQHGAELEGLADHFPTMTFKPDPDVGMLEESAVLALHELIRDDVLRLAGHGWEAAIELVDDVGLRRYRRQLMGSQPEVAGLIYQAGSNWAALALTAENNWAKALESVARKRTSAIPMRRQGPVAVVR